MILGFADHHLQVQHFCSHALDQIIPYCCISRNIYDGNFEAAANFQDLVGKVLALEEHNEGRLPCLQALKGKHKNPF